MKVTRVRFDGQRFFLDPEQDVAETKASVVAAVRAGAEFVDFTTIEHGTISLLVTASVPVRFEVLERTAEDLEQLQADPPPLDVSAWFDQEF